MSSIEEILADVKQEGADPFAAMETDTPTESPTVNEPKEEVKKDEPENTPKEGDDTVPFHKHPRWIERENELKSLREREEENARVLAELTAFKEEATKRFDPQDTSVPDWFGGTAEAWQKYQEHESSRESQIEQKVLDRQEQVKQQAQADVQKWNAWVDTEVAKLESDGLKFDRNELIKTMLDYRPTDDQNNFDFKKGYQIYEALKGKDTSSSQARKQLADSTSHTSRGESKEKNYMTPEDLRNRSWGSL